MHGKSDDEAKLLVNETNVEMLYSVQPKLYKKRRFSQNFAEYPIEEAIITELPDDGDISHTDVAEHMEMEKEAVKNMNAKMTDCKPKKQIKRKSTLEVRNFDIESTPRQTRSKRKLSNTTPENPQRSTSSKATENSGSPSSLDVSSQSTDLTDVIIVPIGTKTNTDEIVSDRNIRSPEIMRPDKKLITSILPVPEKGNKSDIPAGENIVTDLENDVTSSVNSHNESTESNGTYATDTVKPSVREIGKGVEPAENQGKFLDFAKTANSNLIPKISTCINQDTAQQMTPDQNLKLAKLVKMTSGISSGTRNTAPENSQSWKYFNMALNSVLC